MKCFLMKKVNVLFYSVVFTCLISCSNQTSDSSDTNDPVTTVSPATSPAIPPVNKAVTPPVKTTQAPEKKEPVEVKTGDTPRTEISIGQKGGSIKTKKGSDISVDDKGVKIGSKDVRIDIKRDPN